MRFGLRELIFFVVLLAVPVASYIFVFKPRNEEIRQAQDEVRGKQQELKRLREVTERIDDLGLAIEQGREAIELVEAKLPSQEQVDVVLEDIWQLARRARLTLKSVKSETPVPAALYMEQPLKVVMEGEFDGFYQFLQELEGLDRITRVHRMKLERFIGLGRKDPSSGRMKADFTLSIYFQPRSAIADV